MEPPLLYLRRELTSNTLNTQYSWHPHMGSIHTRTLKAPAQLHTFTHTRHAHAYTHSHVHTCTYVCIHTFARAHTHMHMHTHSQAKSNKASQPPHAVSQTLAAIARFVKICVA
jgi:hypothetical protein